MMKTELTVSDPIDHQVEIPLAMATPVVDDDACGQDARGNARVFLLIAPADLRKGWRLDIRVPADGTTTVVRVPQHVQRGEQFHARECGPVQHRWFDGEFSCALANAYRPCDWGFCLLSTFCGWIAWGYIARRMGLDCCGSPSTSQRVVAWTFYLTIVLGILKPWFATLLLSLALLVFSVTVRAAVRRRYKIDKSWALGDCWIAVFFNCCLAMHTHRHMRFSGDNPVNCQGTGVRVVKQVEDHHAAQLGRTDEEAPSRQVKATVP